jgi:hypothetical protein
MEFKDNNTIINTLNIKFNGFLNEGMPKVLQPGGWRASGRRFDPGLGLKKSHSPIPLKAHGKGMTVGRLGYGPLCMGGQSPRSKAQVKDQPMSHSHR